MTNVLPRGIQIGVNTELKTTVPLLGETGGKARVWDITTRDGVSHQVISEHPQNADPQRFVTLLSPPELTIGARRKELGNPSEVSQLALTLGASVIDVLSIRTPRNPGSLNDGGYVLGKPERTANLLTVTGAIHDQLHPDMAGKELTVALHNLMDKSRLDPESIPGGFIVPEIIDGTKFRKNRDMLSEDFTREVVTRYQSHLPATRQRFQSPQIPPTDAFKL